MASSLAALLRAWRERGLLTQEQLAVRSGVGIRTIRRLESVETHRPHHTTLGLLAGALELTEVERAQLVEAARPKRAGAPLATPYAHHQLPADIPDFAGRIEPLLRLDELASYDATPARTATILAIVGTPGVGKTALAVHWAHRVAARFPDGQLYLNLHGFHPDGPPLEPAVAIRGLLESLGVPPRQLPTGLDAQAALYRSVLNRKRILVVLDNARSAEQVRPLLPGAPGCLAVVTSRDRLTGLVAREAARRIVLELLSLDEARQLLAGRLGHGRVAAEPEPVAEIITSCARLPLALAVAGAHAAAHPDRALASLAADLNGGVMNPLDTLATGDDLTDVRQVLQWSYLHLNTDTARLFRLLGLHPGPDFSTPAVASLVGLPPGTVSHLLAELAGAHLLTEHPPGRYAFHDLLRTFATEQTCRVDPPGQRRAALHRLLDHYLHTANTAAHRLEPTRSPIAIDPAQPATSPEQPADREQARAWFSAERSTLLAILDRAARTGWNRYAWKLSWTMAGYLYRDGRWHEWEASQRVALAAAERLADPWPQVHAHRNLAHYQLLRLGRPDEAHAHLRRALALAAGSGDRPGQAIIHIGLAFLWERQDEPRRALEHARRALDLYAASGDRSGRARAINAVGWYHTLLGDHLTTIRLCECALSLLHQLGDLRGQAEVWDSLGYAHDRLGQPDRAIACYQHALAIYHSLADVYGTAVVLNHVGDAHRTAGDPAAACDSWQQALTILSGLNHPDAVELATKLHDLRPAIASARAG